MTGAEAKAIAREALRLFEERGAAAVYLDSCEDATPYLMHEGVEMVPMTQPQLCAPVTARAIRRFLWNYRASEMIGREGACFFVMPVAEGGSVIGFSCLVKEEVAHA